MPPYDELSRHLSYDPLTGVGTWLTFRGSNAQKGAFAGCLKRNGYVYIGYKLKIYKAHRLFWFLQTGHDPGGLTIDHIDGNKSNNKFSNLRLATQSQQICNTTKRCDNSSGHKGVHFNKKKQKYEAYIKIDKKQHLGSYKTFKEAVAARQAKELELFGEFSSLHRLNNDKLLPDHDEQQLSVFWHPSFRGQPADCKGFGQQHVDSNPVPGAAGLC
jgi:uncharacterized protein YktA (UPF0223 family)